MKKIIHCKTEELEKRVLQKLEDETELRWSTGENPTRKSFWYKYETETVIYINNNITYSRVSMFNEDDEDNIITADEFLGEDTKIIKELNGIKVGDRVKYKDYEGYVAVINPRHGIYLLRLDGYRFSDNSSYYWYEEWYPKNERKEEYNCWWSKKEDFEVVKELKGYTGIGIYAFQETTQGSPSGQFGKQTNKINNKPMLKEITRQIKKIIKSKDDQKLYRAGIINEYCELVETGLFAKALYETKGNFEKAREILIEEADDKIKRDENK